MKTTIIIPILLISYLLNGAAVQFANHTDEINFATEIGSHLHDLEMLPVTEADFSSFDTDGTPQFNNRGPIMTKYQAIYGYFSRPFNGYDELHITFSSIFQEKKVEFRKKFSRNNNTKTANNS